MAAHDGNGVTLRETARQKVSRSSQEDGPVVHAARAPVGDGVAGPDRDVLYLLAVLEGRRRSAARTSAHYWQDIDHQIGG